MSEKNENFFQLSQLQGKVAAVFNSLFSIDTSLMFKIKPIDTTINSNESYTHSYSYEILFDDKDYVDSWGQWMKDNWQVSVFTSMLYMLLVLTGTSLMKNRSKFELRPFLVIWNIILAVFSITGSIRVWPDFVNTLTKKGVEYSVCDNSYAYGITGFWSFMFCLSKMPELVDTLFIVLRKQELIFLHWYHHATVLIYCWFSYKDFAPSGRWFMTMNYVVHSLMYSYYACKAMRIRVPRFLSQLITTGQLIQMVAGCYVNYLAWNIQANGSMKCNNNVDNIFWSSIMYLTYFILFLNFFIQTYFIKSNKKTTTSKSSLTKIDAKTGQAKKIDENNNKLMNGNAKKIN